MTDDEIPRKICEGGKARDASVLALYDLHARPMLRYFMHGGASGDDAKDILQETIVKIVLGAPKYTGRGLAKAWFWQIARNCLTDWQRKKGRQARREVPSEDEEEPEESVAESAAPASRGGVDECVSAGLEKFGEQYPERAYVLTLQMDGLRIDEISTLIGRTVAATKEYLSQCKKRIGPFIAHCREFLEA